MSRSMRRDICRVDGEDPGMAMDDIAKGVDEEGRVKARAMAPITRPCPFLPPIPLRSRVARPYEPEPTVLERRVAIQPLLGYPLQAAADEHPGVRFFAHARISCKSEARRACICTTSSRYPRIWLSTNNTTNSHDRDHHKKTRTTNHRKRMTPKHASK